MSSLRPQTGLEESEALKEIERFNELADRDCENSEGDAERDQELAAIRERGSFEIKRPQLVQDLVTLARVCRKRVGRVLTDQEYEKTVEAELFEFFSDMKDEYQISLAVKQLFESLRMGRNVFGIPFINFLANQFYSIDRKSHISLIEHVEALMWQKEKEALVAV